MPSKEPAFMSTKCNQPSFSFQALGRRQLVGRFDGGRITSDGGGLLLRETNRVTGLIPQLAQCFWDGRDGRFVRHPVQQLLAQRVYGLALGYEDLNDHDELREDELLGILVEKSDPQEALAGKSTLNRVELTTNGRDRYKKVVVDEEAVESFFVGMYLQSRRRAPRRIILDLDATDDPLHGKQEGRFFHGFHGCYCYLPLYIFSDDGYPLWAQLRRSNIDAAAGSKEAVEKIVDEIRQHWPKVKILLRADSGFAREELMVWCESNQVDYLFGLAKNPRLIRQIEEALEQARQQFDETGKSARLFCDFSYITRKSWSRERRVIGKAEHLAKGSNPRFIVTSLSAQHYPARDLYEKTYCRRGDMENRIKEQQLALFADRTSSSRMKANQLRLWFSTAAYLLIHQFRRLGLKGTRMARAQCDTIRLKLLKIGAQIKISVRRILISLASGYPYERIFAQVYRNLIRAGPTCT
jgi:hypothetical protein